MSPSMISSLVGWSRELLRTAPGLLDAYRPGSPLDRRTRERMLIAMAEVDEAPISVWIHEGWSEFLGERTPAEADDAFTTHARRSARAGRPVAADGFDETVGHATVRAARAAVAGGAVADIVDNAATDLMGRITGRVPMAAPDALLDAALVLAAAPVAVPTIVTAGAMRVVARTAPPMPDVDPPEGEANLLAHLLVAAAPSILANAALRTVALRLPITVDIGMRHGKTCATLRVGQGRVSVVNYITKEAVVVIEGEVEALLRHASGSLVRELRALRLRPG